jgi:hypothetical protein
MHACDRIAKRLDAEVDLQKTIEQLTARLPETPPR